MVISSNASTFIHFVKYLTTTKINCFLSQALRNGTSMSFPIERKFMAMQ